MKTFITSTLIAGALALSAVQSVAENTGIQFGKMPVGTKAFYRHTNGDKWVDVFKGVKRGNYVVERFTGHAKTSGRPIQTRYYDKQGRLSFYRAYGGRSKPYKIAYKPYSCFYAVGNCNHTERFSGNGYVHSGTTDKWVMNTKKTKGGYLTTWYEVKDPDGGNVYFTELGKYNLRAFRGWGSKRQFNVKLVKLVEGS